MESKNIKYYLALYLGCEVQTERGIETLVSVGLLGSDAQRFRTLAPAMSFTNDWSKSNKLILRPLSSMTEEEFEEFKKCSDSDFSKMVVIESMTKGDDYTRLCHSAFAQQYLLSKSFDLFGFIDAGLAIKSK